MRELNKSCRKFLEHDSLGVKVREEKILPFHLSRSALVLMRLSRAPSLGSKNGCVTSPRTKNKKISRGRARVRRRQILKTIVRNTLHVASHHIYRRCTSKPLSPCARPSLLCSRGPFQAEHVKGHRRRTQDTLLYNPLFFFQSRGKLNSCKDEREGISSYTHLCSCMSF